MSVRVGLVGHCGPDMSYLILALNSAGKVAVERINEEAALQQFVKSGGGLLLVNRALDGDFSDESGVELIARIQGAYPRMRSMLISNYEEAQAAAEKAGAMPGFGKREIGSPKVKELLRTALGE